MKILKKFLLSNSFVYRWIFTHKNHIKGFLSKAQNVPNNNEKAPFFLLSAPVSLNALFSLALHACQSAESSGRAWPFPATWLCKPRVLFEALTNASCWWVCACGQASLQSLVPVIWGHRTLSMTKRRGLPGAMHLPPPSFKCQQLLSLYSVYCVQGLGSYEGKATLP